MDSKTPLSDNVKINMKRIEIHSHEPRVNVYLSSQNADKAKRYTIAVENLSVPAIESRILNTPLFEIRRRFGIEYPEDEPEDGGRKVPRVHTIKCTQPVALGLPTQRLLKRVSTAYDDSGGRRVQRP